MKPCKRIEIVIEEPLARRLADLLTELGTPGYTLIHETSGRGDRGMRRGNEPAGTSTNCIFIIACDRDEIVQRFIEGVRPMLSQSGGMCVVSDAHWVRH